MGAPVKHTCPDNDKVIKRIKTALRSAESGLKEFKGEESYSWFKDIEDNLDGVEWELEGLRSANRSLREWGEGLETELENAAAEINTLENRLEEHMQGS